MPGHTPYEFRNIIGIGETVMDERVEHRVSGQQGILKSQGIWYSAVRFDGEDGTSCVANDSLRRLS